MPTSSARTLLCATVAAIALGAGARSAAAQTAINGCGASLPAPTYGQEDSQFNGDNPAYDISYISASSGKGQTALVTNAPTGCGLPGNVAVHYAGSDSPVSSSNLALYNDTTNNPAGRASAGPFIQIPSLGVGITFPIQNAKVTTNGGGAPLTDAQLCGIFSGQITDFSQLSSKFAPGPITVVYRRDLNSDGSLAGSGTTFLLTQHLAAVCPAGILPGGGSFAATTVFASLFPNNTPPANFSGAQGSGGVAGTLLGQSSAIGYLSPDYTSIAPNSPNTTSLKVAKVVNAANGIAYTPTVANIRTGLSNPGAGSTNATPPTGAAASDPNNWIPLIPVTNLGYPIVGYTTLEMVTCYASTNVATGWRKFLNLHLSNTTYRTIIQNNGFVQLPNTPSGGRYVTAIKNTFLSNNSGLNLNFTGVTGGSRNPNCAGLPGR